MINKELDAKQLSRRQLAYKIGLPPASVNNYLDSETIPTMKSLERIAKYFRVPVSALTDESAAPPAVTHHEEHREPIHVEGFRRKNPITCAVNKELSYFSAFIKWAGRHGYITPRQIHIDKLPYKRPLPSVLTFEEVIRIIRAAEPVYRVFFLLMYALGLRVNEVRNIRIGDIDHLKNTIRIKQKGGALKILPMPTIATMAIKQIVDPGASLRADDYIFLNKMTRRPIQDVRKAIDRACKKAKIDRHVNPHLFRHSFATHLVAEQINLRVIQRLLGHSQISMTERYTQVDISVLRKAGEILNNKFLSTENAEAELIPPTGDGES